MWEGLSIKCLYLILNLGRDYVLGGGNTICMSYYNQG